MLNLQLFIIQPKDNKIAANEASPNHFPLTLVPWALHKLIASTASPSY
jgi:hypothetical protein